MGVCPPWAPYRGSDLFSDLSQELLRYKGQMWGMGGLLFFFLSIHLVWGIWEESFKLRKGFSPFLRCVTFF